MYSGASSTLSDPEPHSLICEPTRKRAQALEPNDDFHMTTLECSVHVWQHNQVVPEWVLLPERVQVGSL